MPPSNENLDSPTASPINNSTILGSNDIATNPRATTPTPLHSNPNHHSRSNSAARRSIPPVQGQLPSAVNCNSTSNALPTAMPSKQPHGQPPGIPIGPGVPAFDGSRSPPGSKNLNHVPCKFFRQGACQAGKACPFSHSTDPTTESAPCKYFSKGNCKFGGKCALAHILPDGRRVNRPQMHNNSHLHFGRMDPAFTNHRSALHNSLMQANSHVGHHTPNHSLGGPEDFPALPGSQPIPQAEQAAAQSISETQLASPRNSDSLAISSLASSQRTLGPLDATLPASIDRYDYSYYAKHGPFASSVPNTFGVDSPPPSLPSSIRGEATLSALRRSAFGDDDGAELSRSAQLREGSFGERILHSSASRRNKVYSSSYGGTQTLFNGCHGINGARDNSSAIDTSEGAFAFEEDFLPESLTDLLTPAERNRRMSRTDDDNGAAFGRSFTAPGTPGDAFGSPPIGSPGSWGPLINRHKREDDHSQISGLGHVGSPLRHSYLHSDANPIGVFASSLGRSGISALTQSLKFGSFTEEPSIPSKGIAINGRPIERTTSSPRLGNSKVHPIDEEPETQFNLEVEEEGPSKQTGGFSNLGIGVGDRFLSGRP
ncbi:hypothetical protein FN846DRAFT_1026396 [Sphaerosporella brunnea]|uniref:C3H1-type domain-containing protein n=1 Tax=Sphaerosporella brunnea TaxID=1250544 RepID=A0A5J5F9L9_9PEZI|nr:hypothetical protein FN846DRAFT_1026396 [Sphaerosporella brunnea]